MYPRYPYILNISFFSREDAAFNTSRLVVIIVFSVLRFISIKSHLQAHLSTALDKAENCQKEVRHITNLEFRKKVVLFQTDFDNYILHCNIWHRIQCYQ